MKQLAILLVLTLSLTACKTTPDYGKPLPPGAPALLPLDKDDPRPDMAAQFDSRAELLPALENSLAWMRKPTSTRHFPIEGVSHERALLSLERFREILGSATDGIDFSRRIEEEFTIYKSAGWDGKGGGVLFTGYCTPELRGSRVAGGEYRYPLYALPKDLVKGEEGEILGQQTDNGLEPYPTRSVIEASAMLSGKGLELVYLADPIDAYIAHVNGSAFVRLEDGTMLKLGYAGKNGRKYTSLGQELVKEKRLDKESVSLAGIRRWAQANPQEVEEFLNRNDSFVFFTPIEHNPHGSLNVPVTGWRSIATDKTLFPRGGVTFVSAKVGYGGDSTAVEQFFMDQDTGGAIRTAGRADLYLGAGDEAERVAGSTRAEGQLYYFFLKE
ncbi:MAG: Membrane-bound lytic murein transglycosylase precursor [Planctomycetota bacterium]|jgi:membrane-bound lytic murein transglycosylase A